MKTTSYGVIPFDEQRRVLMIRLRNGEHWGFPKGGPDAGETPLETAERELFEETGVRVVRLLREEPLKEFYEPKPGEQKTVSYYLAEVQGYVIAQQEEVLEYRWVTLDEGERLATFAQIKDLICDVKKILPSIW